MGHLKFVRLVSNLFFSPLAKDLEQRWPSKHSFSMFPESHHPISVHPTWNMPFRNWKWCLTRTPVGKSHMNIWKFGAWTFWQFKTYFYRVFLRFKVFLRFSHGSRVRRNLLIDPEPWKKHFKILPKPWKRNIEPSKKHWATKFHVMDLWLITRNVSSMIHSAKPIVTQLAKSYFLLFCFSRFEKWGWTCGKTIIPSARDCGLAEWINTRLWRSRTLTLPKYLSSNSTYRWIISKTTNSLSHSSTAQQKYRLAYL